MLRERRAAKHTRLCSVRPARHWVEKPPATAFKLPAVEPVPAPLRIMGPCDPPHFLSPQHRTDARKQFPEAEGLYDVVIRPEFEADDAIDFVWTVAGRDNDRNVRVRANFPQQIKPVVLAEPQIQNDQAGKGSYQMVQLCSV